MYERVGTMPELVNTIAETREKIAAARTAGLTIGLVPTMGALHEGHLSLLRRARADCGYVVVSVFVNPTQFGQGEDLDKYPRILQQDLELCDREKADLVFAPTDKEMYPPGFVTYVEPDESLGGRLCGASRPTHFRGVDTVVLKLFNICSPDKAYFGQKDYQQSVIIRKMAEDLNLDIEVITCPTVREEDGLAISSRNSYLDPDERAQATCLHKALLAAREAVEQEKITDPELVKSRMISIIETSPSAKIDYVEFIDADSLESLESLDGRVVAAMAVFVGSTRLIDNMILNTPRG
jgi:pantoate--beta-alanine ligase